MTKDQAFEVAESCYAQKRPTQLSGVVTADDCLILAGHEEDVMIVVYSDADLIRIKSAIEILLNKRQLL